ncbi:MAG: bifunctional demethylmenaquinone methyltransferase/2-methoxy-6-polyprenyl-1,4-benzoquinol methylase UbiE [Verrucomicrobia bacterium]|nr:bifunctional demethylmenaquinone methyltransferase/2-methoxy-6-polyprenyl-1,4-benzoquinol methylase UbiE [Verrucomicrobiota bacterium]MCF7707308.1 bifunctional demethylmenaquinone methyltransferase/2-methoxy-6-polyprenyl-1,4-benzoquinol methylase UbiE [Verrucomicrobiota bacterium]
MNNRYYKPGGDFPAHVKSLFTKIAPHYDIINDIQSLGLHRLWKKRLVALAKVRPNESALDLCCGTGDITRILAQKTSKVIGLDFNKAMLEIAARRCRKHSGIRFVHADALNAPFPDASFDVVTIAYGLRNLTSPDAGIKEIHRLLKPRGRALILDFGTPTSRILRTFYFAYLKFVVPVFGLVFCGDKYAYSYIIESLHNYPAQAGVQKILGTTGFTNISTIQILGGIMSIHLAVK